MRTEVINTESQCNAGTKRGAEIIKSGGLVAFPTETVYGLGANGLDGDAVRGIFEAKGRPADNPLILHIAKKSDVRRLWKKIPQHAQQLMDTFWPGPLTLIANRADIVPDEVTAGLDTVAVRLPADRTARELIAKSGVPIAAPSANRSGRPSPTTAAHVLADLGGRIPLILDGGPCKYGVESTVLSLVGRPTILRPGAITYEMISAAIGPVELAKCILEPLGEHETARSPGMKYKHYAPDASVVVVCGEPQRVAKYIGSECRRAELEGHIYRILATDQTIGYYKTKGSVSLGNRERPETLCANLFSALRGLDADTEVVYAEGIPETDEGLAYMNRLLRAAGFCVVRV